MVKDIRSVLIGLTKKLGPDEPSSALRYGLSLAQLTAAHATVQAASVRLALASEGLSRSIAGLVAAENRRLGALAVAAAERAQADAAAAGVVCSVETPQLSYPELVASFVMRSRVHDLTVLDAEPRSFDLDRDLIEAVLTGSGRPLLIVPPGRELFLGRRILVAWDGSGRAARAVADALPLLRAAEQVEIVWITGEKELPAAITGAELAPHLARHGITVSVVNLTARDGDVARTLRDRADSWGADLIVMGAYVHSRLRERVFGGVTRSLLADSPVPLFMAH